MVKCGLSRGRSAGGGAQGLVVAGTPPAPPPPRPRPPRRPAPCALPPPRAHVLHQLASARNDDHLCRLRGNAVHPAASTGGGGRVPPLRPRARPPLARRLRRHSGLRGADPPPPATGLPPAADGLHDQGDRLPAEPSRLERPGH